jgi:hypothetical protein
MRNFLTPTMVAPHCGTNFEGPKSGSHSAVLICKHEDYFIFLMEWDWVHLVLRPLFELLYQPQTIDDDGCGSISGRQIGRGNRSTRRKPAPVPLCAPQILHVLTWARTWTAAVVSRRLTAWAMARPTWWLLVDSKGFWRWCRTLGITESIVCYSKDLGNTRFRKMDLFTSSVIQVSSF